MPKTPEEAGVDPAHRPQHREHLRPPGLARRQGGARPRQLHRGAPRPPPHLHRDQRARDRAVREGLVRRADQGQGPVEAGPADARRDRGGLPGYRGGGCRAQGGRRHRLGRTASRPTTAPQLADDHQRGWPGAARSRSASSAATAERDREDHGAGARHRHLRRRRAAPLRLGLQLRRRRLLHPRRSPTASSGCCAGCTSTTGAARCGRRSPA